MGKKSRRKRETKQFRQEGPQPKEQKPRSIRAARDLPIQFSKKNYIGFALGVLTIAGGFLSLSLGSITLAPILLVLGYCVIIPIAIILK